MRLPTRRGFFCAQRQTYCSERQTSGLGSCVGSRALPVFGPLWDEDGEIPELKTHCIYWNVPPSDVPAGAAGLGGGQRWPERLFPEQGVWAAWPGPRASWGGCTFPPALWELLGPRARGRFRAGDAFWAQVVAAEGVLLLLSPLSQGGTGEGCGKKKKKADNFKQHGCRG